MGILAVVMLTVGALAAGAAWARHRTEASLRPEIANLERREQEARAAARAKTDLLANASHELRTPLHGILGTVDLLLAADLPAAQCRQIQAVDKSAEALLALVDDLLDFSKIEVGKLRLHATDFHLRDLLREIVDLLAPRAKAQGIELRLEVDSEVPDELHCDQSRLRQMLLNLTGNAIKFTQEGHVDLRVGLETPATGEERRLRFVVRDTGIGISPSDQARIFNPFVQAESSAAGEIGGTGLGLVISKSLVELMGGHMGFESTRRVGSTFWFRVPLMVARAPVRREPATARAYRPHGPQDAARTRKLNILVVDDNAGNRRVAESQVQALGYRAETAMGGARALEALTERYFDLVLMDCQMPKLDGYETTRRFRRRDKDTGRHTVVIGVTANAMKGQREKVLAAGMDDLLAKPYRTGDLGALLDRWLSAPSEAPPPAVFRGLESTIDEDLRAKIAKDFQREGTRDVEKMRAALTAGDARALEQSAHSLGGSAVFLQATVLDKLCRELENLARQGDLSGCESRLPALEKEYGRLVVELEDLLRGRQA